MQKLVRILNRLKRSLIHTQVEQRIAEFEKCGKQARTEELFSELCFCILTANFSAERAIQIQREIGDGFLKLSERALARRLRALGHRFPNSRAAYIVANRKYSKNLKRILAQNDPRPWLVRNVKGIGWKEASHFLRNIGFKDYAIIDFHILNLLNRERLVRRPKSLTKAKYLEIERKLRQLAHKLDLSLAELDLYLWYLETGKILK